MFVRALIIKLLSARRDVIRQLLSVGIVDTPAHAFVGATNTIAEVVNLQAFVEKCVAPATAIEGLFADILLWRFTVIITRC